MRFERHLLPLAFLAFVAFLGGCRNACQGLCKDMYDYALDECGYEWSRDDLKACYEAYATSETPRSTRDSCREYRGEIGAWWDCEDIAEYFEAASHEDTGDTQEPQDTQDPQDTGDTGGK